MYHKQLADDRVKSAIKEGLEAQEVARELKSRPEQAGFWRRLLAKLIAMRSNKEHKRTPLSPRHSELSR